MKIKLNKYKIWATAMMAVVLSIFFLSDSHAGDDDLYKDKKFRHVKNKAFGFGEKFEYNVQYGFVKAGEGTLQIMNKPMNIKGRDAYQVRFNVKSVPSIDLFYKVRDSYSTVIDVKGIFPWIFERKLNEGSYHYYSKTYFDQLGHYAYTSKKKKYKVPPYIYDVLTAFYYVRTLDLSSMRAGDILSFKNFWKDSVYVLNVRINKKQIVEVPAGKFRCIVIEPVDLQGGLFKNIGNIYIYVTDDERKMPVKVATKIIIGEVTAELTKYSGLRGPLKSKIK